MSDKTIDFKSNIEAMLKSMDGFVNTKTVVGDAINLGDNIILPLADVSFGVGAGAFEENAKNRGCGGLGAKISPSAVLVINESGAKIMSVKEGSAMGKIMDMVPDLINRFTKKGEKKEEPDINFEAE